MKPPLPFCYVPTTLAKVAAVRALYALGYKWPGYSTIERCVRAVNEWGEREAYPYVRVIPDQDRLLFATSALLGEEMRAGRGTLVNSIGHMVSYLTHHHLTKAPAST